MEGWRLNPLFFAESAPDWYAGRSLARGIRNYSAFACVIIVIAAALFAVNNGVVTTVDFIVLLLTIGIWGVSIGEDRDTLIRLVSPLPIRERLAAQGKYVDAQEQSAQDLNPGDLACPNDRWAEWKNQANGELERQEPLCIVIAVGVKDDNRLLVGLSGQRGTVEPARTGHWKYQMKSWRRERVSYEEGTYRTAGAVADLVEIVPMPAALVGQPSPCAAGNFTQYLEVWSVAEALGALLIARAANLIDVVFSASRTPSQRQHRQVIEQADRVLASGSVTAVNFAGILSSSGGRFLDIPLMTELLALLRLTDLGGLWRDAGRPSRHEVARTKVLQWLVAEQATKENPQRMKAYPIAGRATGDHFLSQGDLLNAVHSLKRSGYIALHEGNNSLSAWPTARGISHTREAPIMESGSGRDKRQFTVTIGDVSGGQVNIASDWANQVTVPLVDLEELRALLRTIVTGMPHIVLAPGPKAEFEQALEQANTEASKTMPDRGRLASAVRTVGAVLAATGENMLANVLTAWLAKQGFPGLGS